MSDAIVHTIGHGNRSAEELVETLRVSAIGTLVDVRAHPESKRHPQFSMNALRATLEAAGITYHWAGRQLGGHRAARADSPHVALRDEALRGYADYMDGTAFEKGAAALISLARGAPTAVMCAERDPDHCHRSLLADWLVLQGVRVVHLLGPGETREHVLRPEARRESARLVYDRNASGALPLG